MAYYQQNMLSIKSRTTLAEILAEIVILSQSIESYREALANVPYFDCIALFRFLDKEQKGFLREKDFQRVIGTSHRKLLTYAFSWFDNMKVGEISRLQFATFLLPKDDLQLRELVAQRVEQPQISISQDETINAQFGIFRELLLEIINKEMKIIELRHKLVNNPDYSIKGVLLAIDCNTHDWICSEDIFKFMKNYGFDVTLRMVEKLVEVINYSMNGKITQEQLRWTIEGFQTKNKDYLNKIKMCNKKECPKKPINFQPEFEEHKRQHKNEFIESQKKNVYANQYKLLVEKFRLAEQEEKKVDQQLVKCQEKVIQTTRQLCEKELTTLQIKKEMEEKRRAKQREEMLIQYSLNKELEELMLKNQIIQTEAERLIRLQNRLSIYEDTAQIKKTSLLPAQKYTASTGFGYRQPIYKENYPIRQSPKQHQPYKYDTHLSQISNFDDGRTYHQSYAKNESISRHIESSDVYLNAARQMRQKIKKERQIEREIQEKLKSSSYSAKFNYLPVDSKYVPLQKEAEPYQRIPASQSRASSHRASQEASGSKELRQSSKKESSHINSSLNDVNITFDYQSPQRRAHNPGSIINKNTVSTMNKMGDEH